MKLPIHLESRDQLGVRIVSPSAGRNKEAIGALLADYLPKSAKVFEVASGSGAVSYTHLTLPTILLV